jgi:hypothetical protein
MNAYKSQNYCRKNILLVRRHYYERRQLFQLILLADIQREVSFVSPPKYVARVV